MEGRNLHEASELSEPSTNRTSERGKLSKQHQTRSGRKVYPYSGLHLTKGLEWSWITLLTCDALICPNGGKILASINGLVVEIDQREWMTNLNSLKQRKASHAWRLISFRMLYMVWIRKSVDCQVAGTRRCSGLPERQLCMFGCTGVHVIEII